MGFGTIVANVIMFISVLLLATAAVGTFKGVVEESTNSLRVQSTELSNSIKTNFEITSANYSQTHKNLTMFVLNTGKTTLDLKNVDVFVNEFLIDRNETYRDISIVASTDTRNKGLWDPREYIKVEVYLELEPGTTHMASLAGPYGNRVDKEFSFS